MLLLNFSHPLTPAQMAQVETLLGQPLTRIIDIPAQIDPQQPMAKQIEQMVASTALSAAEWQSEPLLVVPPALNFSAVTLLAELHGRMGYFPPVLRLRPAAGSLPPQFEVAEVLNLQAIRDTARRKR